jgi:hypothetical protein
MEEKDSWTWITSSAVTSFSSHTLNLDRAWFRWQFLLEADLHLHLPFPDLHLASNGRLLFLSDSSTLMQIAAPAALSTRVFSEYQLILLACLSRLDGFFGFSNFSVHIRCIHTCKTRSYFTLLIQTVFCTRTVKNLSTFWAKIICTYHFTDTKLKKNFEVQGVYRPTILV